MSEPESDPSSLRKQLVGDAVVIGFFSLLVMGILAMGDLVAERTRDLRARGQTVVVEVTRVERAASPVAHVRYVVDGVPHATSAKVLKPAPPVGARLTGRYLPEEPGRIRLTPTDEATIEDDTTPFRTLPWFFGAPLLILVASRIARASGRDPYPIVGKLLGLVFMAIVVGVNFGDDVRAQITRRLGQEVLGLDSVLVVSFAELVVLGPLLFVWGQAALSLMRLAPAGRAARGASFFVWVLAGNDPAMNPHDRKRFLVTSTLLGLLMVAAIIGLSATE